MKRNFSDHVISSLDDLVVNFSDENIQSTLDRCHRQTRIDPSALDVDWLVDMYDSVLHHSANMSEVKALGGKFAESIGNYSRFEDFFLDSVSSIFNNIEEDFKTYSFAADNNQHPLNVSDHISSAKVLVDNFRRLSHIFDGCHVDYSGSDIQKYSSFLRDLEQLGDTLESSVRRYCSLDLSGGDIGLFVRDMKKNLFAFYEDVKKSGKKFIGSRNLYSFEPKLKDFVRFRDELDLVSKGTASEVVQYMSYLDSWISQAEAALPMIKKPVTRGSLKSLPSFSPLKQPTVLPSMLYLERHMVYAKALDAECSKAFAEYSDSCRSLASSIARDYEKSIAFSKPESLHSLRDRLLVDSWIFEKFDIPYSGLLSSIDEKHTRYERSLKAEELRSEASSKNAEAAKVKAAAALKQAEAEVELAAAERDHAAAEKRRAAAESRTQVIMNQLGDRFDAIPSQVEEIVDGKLKPMQEDYVETTESIFDSLGRLEDSHQELSRRVASMSGRYGRHFQGPASGIDDSGRYAKLHELPSYCFTDDLPADYDISSSRVKHLVLVLNGRGYRSFSERFVEGNQIIGTINRSSGSDDSSLDSIYSAVEKCYSEGMVRHEIDHGRLDEKLVVSFLENLKTLKDGYLAA